MVDKKKTEKVSMADIANLLHSAVFSLEKSIQEVMGTQHIIVTSHAAKYIANIEKQRGTKLFSKGNLDESIQNFVDHTSGSEFFEKVEVKKVDEERYQVSIMGCTLAKTGVHDVLKPGSDVCPMALAVAGMFKYIEPERDVIAEPSIFESENSSTEIHVMKIR